jgi:hypothetical protein
VDFFDVGVQIHPQSVHVGESCLIIHDAVGCFVLPGFQITNSSSICGLLRATWCLCL